VKVYGYIRVSTTEQALNGEGLETQRHQIVDYAMMKGWEIVDYFIEHGVSGSVPLAERPEGQRILEIVEKGDAIVISKLDRAFRSATDALGTLEELKEQGVGLHMIDLGGDVCGNRLSKLVFTILSAVAEAERYRIRQRIREVKHHLKSQPVYGGGKRPFGWALIGGGLIPIPDEQDAIDQMKMMKAAGATYRKIGAKFGKDPRTIQRILERITEVAGWSADGRAGRKRRKGSGLLPPQKR
jgi:putative DNA-invertase from lambdoid prophage Rac